jgi:hypothetical protein
VYVPSKGRYANTLTAKMFAADRVPFTLVVEPAEQDHYAAQWGDKATIEVLPADNYGLMAARNWIRDHAEAAGHARHWQFDDNIRGMLRPYKGKRLPIRSGAALAPAEDFVDRYTNVALAGFQYYTFHPCTAPPWSTMPPRTAGAGPTTTTLTLCCRCWWAAGARSCLTPS